MPPEKPLPPQDTLQGIKGGEGIKKRVEEIRKKVARRKFGKPPKVNNRVEMENDSDNE